MATTPTQESIRASRTLEMTDTTSRFRLLLFRSLAVFLGCALVTALLETALLGYEHVTGKTLRAQLLRYNNCFESDETLGFRLRAGCTGICLTDEFQYHTRVNSLHMRDLSDSAHLEPQTAGKPIILALGDSFTFGTGVELEQTFLALTEKRLDAIILKAGVPGYNIHQYDRYVRLNALSLNPSVVLVNLFTANDLAADIARLEVTHDGYLAESYRDEVATSLFMRLNRWSFNHSALFRFLKSRGVDFHLIGRLLESLGDRASTAENLGISAPPVELLRRVPNDEQQVDTLYFSVERALLRMESFLAQNGVQLVVNLVPFRMQIEPWILRRVVRDVDESDYDRQNIHKRLIEILGRHDIPFIDASAAFIDYYRKHKRSLYWRLDGHFNQAGNRLMAEVLVTEIPRLTQSVNGSAVD